MRIEAYTQVQQVYNTHKAVTAAQAEKKNFSDAVQISSVGKDISVAKQAVAQAQDVRTEITEPIKAQIANGTYQVSMDDFADRLMGKYHAYNALLG